MQQYIDTSYFLKTVSLHRYCFTNISQIVIDQRIVASLNLDHGLVYNVSK